MDWKVKAAIFCLVLFAVGFPIGRQLGSGKPSATGGDGEMPAEPKGVSPDPRSSTHQVTKRGPKRAGAQRPTLDGLLLQRAELGSYPFLGWLAQKFETMEVSQIQRMGRELRDLERREFTEMAEARLLIRDWLIENHPLEAATELLAEAEWERDLQFGDEDVDLEHEAARALSVLAETDPETARRLVRGMHNAEARENLFLQLDFHEMSFEAAQIFKQLALELDPKHAHTAVEIAFVSHAKRDPLSAIEEAEKLGDDHDNRETALRAVAKGYGTASPEEAVRWARNYPEEPIRGKLLTTSLTSAWKSDPQTGLALARELVDADALTGRPATIASTLVPIDPELALDWLTNHGNRDATHWKAAGHSIGNIANSRPAVALELAHAIPEEARPKTIRMRTRVQSRFIPFDAVVDELKRAISEGANFDPERAYDRSKE